MYLGCAKSVALGVFVEDAVGVGPKDAEEVGESGMDPSLESPSWAFGGFAKRTQSGGHPAWT